MENELQKVLRSGAMNIEDIKTKLAVAVKYHKDYPNLVMFKYNQIFSPMGNPVVQNCRGIILDTANNFEVVSYPFDKFFNHGEGFAKEIDWSTARVQEKLDGSLMVMYFYDGKWHVSSSGTPDASGPVGDSGKTFAQLFWENFDKSMMDYMYPNYTYMFELTSMYNRIVVHYAQSGMTLIGVRDNKTLKEIPVSMFKGMSRVLLQDGQFKLDGNGPSGFKVVREFPINTMEALLESMKNFEGIQQEGYVVVDADFNRVKIKHPGYVAIHHMKGNEDTPSVKRMFEIVVNGEGTEVLTYFPEWRPVYEKINTAMDNTINEIKSKFEEINLKVAALTPTGIQPNPKMLKKEFASLAVKTRFSDPLFKLKDGKITDVKEYFASINTDHAMAMIGLSEEKP